MFPEAFAEKWISALTRKNELVLDPFCGRGTTPFQAILMGRRAISTDVNPVAVCVARAKTNAPRLGTLKRRITQLETSYAAEYWERQRKKLPTFFRYAYQA